MKIKKSIGKICIVLMIMFSVTVAFAQPSGGGGGQGQGGNPPSGTGGPIDGGEVILLAVLAGYAYIKLKQRQISKRSV